MHWIALFLFGFAALFWLSYGTRVVWSAVRLPKLRDISPANDASCPRVSILFAARDEEEKLPEALETLLALDYPNFEIVAADDRSKDATRQILHANAARDSRLRIVNIEELPAGWLGKPHALQKAFEASDGEWLLFTDADVHLHPETLRRGIALVQERKLDHLTLMCRLVMETFWEKAALTFFAMGLFLLADPSGLEDLRSKSYVGVGAFQLVRRPAYEAAGTHCKLALEVVDDMRLARNLKLAGFRSTMGLATEFVSVRWHSGVGNIVRGVTKNFFAAANYSLLTVAAQSAGLFFTSALPFLALPFLHGAALIVAAVAAGTAIALEGIVAVLMETSPIYALAHPLGALLFIYMLLRSTAVTMWQGGVTWRDTFYSLDELRRGRV
ncbi:MAG: glycosyltransferase [Acidobacteria bacterium]|nr:glycosyltransferase [Acidobacteriota bacterium]MBS1867592.1 glycosyltransferase [Acidobacteriota bacterium]